MCGRLTSTKGNALQNDLVTIENLKNLATIASAVVAWAAFVLSIANFRIQRKMLKINSDKEDRQQSSIVIYNKRSNRVVGDSETIFTIDAQLQINLKSQILWSDLHLL